MLAKADLSNGQQIFKKQCANCHQFFGEGGKIGPDITGAERSNLDYMLENIVTQTLRLPKTIKWRSCKPQTVALSGLIDPRIPTHSSYKRQRNASLLHSEDIEKRKQSNVSIMPLGLLEPLSEDDIRDLIGYLQRKR